MKFEKFVKSLASTGTIYERADGDRWLASDTALMLIPPTIKSITGIAISPMPEEIDKIIRQTGHTVDAKLVQAIMPFPDGGIKDCVRVFKSSDNLIACPISNDDWTLIEKTDITEIACGYNDELVKIGKVLLVKTYPLIPDDENELVGIIFP